MTSQPEAARGNPLRDAEVESPPFAAWRRALERDPDFHGRLSDMADRWLKLRAELTACDQSLHPPLTDRFGRTWQWRSGDGDQTLYVHDGMAWPADWILAPDLQLPGPALLASASYSLCETCCGAGNLL